MATLILFFLILTIHLILYSLEFEIAAAVNIIIADICHIQVFSIHREATVHIHLIYYLSLSH